MQVRLDLLLARETFPDVFVTTLTFYLQHRFGWQGHITWCQEQSTSIGLLVHPKVNLIFPLMCETSDLRALGAEYAYNSKFILRNLQKAYVHFSVSRPLRRLFSIAWVDISPWPEAISNWCILPGNHSIRVVDIGQDECIVLRKTGFNPVLLENLVRIRQDFPEIPGPRLLESNLEQGWYREQRVNGLPLNRISDPVTVQSGINAARLAMSRIYLRTLLSEPIDKWLELKLQNITAAVARLPLIYEAEIRRTILNLAQALAIRLQLQVFEKNVINIPTALTHGDFQFANILVPALPEDGPVYLIDWEYAGRRCIWYDAMVFELQSRFPKGLSQRVVAWLQDHQRQQLSLEWCGEAAMGWNSLTCLIVFLLEDLNVRLMDTMIPGLLQQEFGFLLFIEELIALEGMSL
jgi:hypothetical protein